MSEQERYLEAFKAYYTLKQEYEHKLHRMKRKIYNNTGLTDREKRAEIAKLDPKCVNCKKPGGTIFTQEGKNLKATCGNTSSPCQLNIDITRGSYVDAFNLLTGAKENSDEKKTEIILSKLNLLFNYTNEEETAEEFEELLNNYKDSEAIVNLVQESIDNVISNPEKLEDLPLIFAPKKKISKPAEKAIFSLTFNLGIIFSKIFILFNNTGYSRPSTLLSSLKLNSEFQTSSDLG